MQPPRSTAICCFMPIIGLNLSVQLGAQPMWSEHSSFFPAFPNAPGVKGGAEGFPVLCDASQMGIPISSPPLCSSTPAVYRMRWLPGELWCQRLYSLNVFLAFQNSCFEFSSFCCKLWTSFLFYVCEREAGQGGGEGRRCTYIWALKALFWLLAWKLGLDLLLACCLNVVQW